MGATVARFAEVSCRGLDAIISNAVDDTKKDPPENLDRVCIVVEIALQVGKRVNIEEPVLGMLNEVFLPKG